MSLRILCYNRKRKGDSLKQRVIGILAHVDAGKTTLSESLLYHTGKIKQLGRVDHQNAFLDYDTQERSRGITIYAKQAMFNWKDVAFTLLDTPGHSDFSSEMERTLKVLDYAILVINGTEGIQNHTKTIWSLLEYYQVPTFIFVNKMDMNVTIKEEVMNQIINQLGDRCIDFTSLNKESFEQMALMNEDYLDEFLSMDKIETKTIQKAIHLRHVIPCYFGSALKLLGIEELLNGLTTYSMNKHYPEEFGAVVYKISRDNDGTRLAHLKITGGSMLVKTKFDDKNKVDQIRSYSGNKFQTKTVVEAGEICCVTGFKTIEAGKGLGIEKSLPLMQMNSYLDYQVVLPKDADVFKTLEYFKQLSEEDPMLHVSYDQRLKEIRVQLMGEIQIEVLKQVMKDRFKLEVDFGQANILYKETITNTVEGVGHFEPLRHYAEVHLLLEPGLPGSGIVLDTLCKEDQLAKNWQRLILTHLQEKEHIGVLIGAPITDVKVTLVAGKGHLKHTEGGDFREATYRALRNSLKKADSILLEPYFDYQLEIPNDYLSKAIYDLENMKAHFSLEAKKETTLLSGKGPVSKMMHYATDVISYTSGQGKFICQLAGYEPCLNEEEVIESKGYDSELDIENPTGSIFCTHGAGFNVKWDEVEKYMHIKYTLKNKKEVINKEIKEHYESVDEELEKIFTRTYGAIKRPLMDKKTVQNIKEENIYEIENECLLIDGYNIIHAWPKLKELTKESLDAARFALMDMMCNYQGFRQCVLIVVFDAYKIKGNIGHMEKYNNIYVTYTKEAQTADMYIERATHALKGKYQIVVATSDALEQLIVLGHGARRISARELLLEVEHLANEKMAEFNRKQPVNKAFLLEEVKEYQGKD